MEQIRTIGKRLKDQFNAQNIILFGSYAIGTATENSDVDILIIAPTQERFYERIATVKRLIRDLRNGLPVSPIVLTQEELEKRLNKNDQFIKEILEDGIRL